MRSQGSRNYLQLAVPLLSILARRNRGSVPVDGEITLRGLEFEALNGTAADNVLSRDIRDRPLTAGPRSCDEQCIDRNRHRTRIRVSAIGTDRLCRPVCKKFRCWRSTGRAAPLPVLLSWTHSCRFMFASANSRGRKQRGRTIIPVSGDIAPYPLSPGLRSYWPSQASSKRQPLNRLLTMIVIPCTTGDRQVPSR